MDNPHPNAAERSERDADISTAIDVTGTVRRNTGGVAWPTVALCAGLTAAYLGVIAGWAVGAVPLWAGCALNSVLSYAFYTVHHDANHKSISGRDPRFRWLDPLCGSIAALPLLLSFKGFSAEHLRHHAHTNDHALDPDAFVIAGPLRLVPVRWLAVTLLGAVQALPKGDIAVAKLLASRLPERDKEPNDRLLLEQRRLRRYNRLGLLALVASIPLGLFTPVFFLWWVPGKLALLALMALFMWLPHAPYDSTERFRNTRIATFRGSTWLLLQQDRHLIHHLYPSVPWYRYRAVFREIRPYLEDQGARIEGRESNPYQPIDLGYRPTTENGAAA